MRVTLPAVTGHPLTFLPVRALATPLEKGLSPHQPPYLRPSPRVCLGCHPAEGVALAFFSFGLQTWPTAGPSLRGVWKADKSEMFRFRRVN